MFNNGAVEYYMTKTKVHKRAFTQVGGFDGIYSVAVSPCRTSINLMNQRWEADGMRFNEQGRKNERTMMHENRHGHDTGIESQIPVV